MAGHGPYPYVAATHLNRRNGYAGRAAGVTIGNSYGVKIGERWVYSLRKPAREEGAGSGLSPRFRAASIARQTGDA
jgi:hypothetical protein